MTRNRVKCKEETRAQPSIPMTSLEQIAYRRIQAFLKGHLLRQSFVKIRRSALLIQKWYLMTCERTKLVMSLFYSVFSEDIIASAGAIVSSFMRMATERKRWKNLMYEKRRANAATRYEIIQK